MKIPSSLASASQTLFAESPGRVAILVTNKKGKRSQAAMKFHDGHAALDWCEKNKAILVYLPAADPSGN
jgi:hypothetical protein